MDDKDLRKRLRKLAKAQDLRYEETRQGKGSHTRIYFGGYFTTVRHGEIGTGLLSSMCKQLGITRKDLDDD